MKLNWKLKLKSIHTAIVVKRIKLSINYYKDRKVQMSGVMMRPIMIRLLLLLLLLSASESYMQLLLLCCMCPTHIRAGFYWGRCKNIPVSIDPCRHMLMWNDQCSCQINYCHLIGLNNTPFSTIIMTIIVILSIIIIIIVAIASDTGSGWRKKGWEMRHEITEFRSKMADVYKEIHFQQRIALLFLVR